MNNLSSVANRFDQLIDLDSPTDFLDGGDPRMRPAIELTAALRSAAAAAPAPLSQEARSAMRERLVALACAAPETAELPDITHRITHALEHSQERVERASHRIGRRMSALVGAVVVLTSIGGVGVAAARSLPGSPFYDLKRATESVQLWATSGQAAKGERHLEFARTRLAEAKKLPAGSPQLAATLHAMNEQTRQANTDLVAVYHSTGSVQPLADLVVFARSQYSALARLGTELPQQLHQDASYSALLLTGLTQEVRSITVGLCHKCAAADPMPGVTVTTPTPAQTAGTKPSPTATPVTTAPTKATPTKTLPAKTPTGLLPTSLTNLLPTIPPASQHQKGQVLPKLSPVPLLTSLAQLLGVG